jgi:hypothetical protein
MGVFEVDGIVDGKSVINDEQFLNRPSWNNFLDLSNFLLVGRFFCYVIFSYIFLEVIFLEHFTYWLCFIIIYKINNNSLEIKYLLFILWNIILFTSIYLIIK